MRKSLLIAAALAILAGSFLVGTAIAQQEENSGGGSGSGIFPQSVAKKQKAETESATIPSYIKDMPAEQTDCSSWLSISCGFARAFNYVMAVLASVANAVTITIFAGLIKLGASILRLALILNATMFEGSSIAKTGFTYTLGLANLGFILGLIVLAFGAMLRHKTINVSRLPKLLLIAFAVNISFYLAQLVVQASNAITEIFINAAVGEQWSAFGTIFGDLYKKANVSPFNMSWGAAASWATLGQTLSNSVFVIIFGVLAVVTISAVGLMFFLKYFIIVFLLILLPFALILWVMPEISIGKTPGWNAWLDSFVRWNIFGPVMAFFLYLAFSFLQNSPPVTPGVQTATAGLLTNSFDLIMAAGLLLGGAYVANSIGITGSGIALSYAKKSGTWTMNKAKTYGARLGTGLGARIGEKQGVKSAISWLAGRPIIGGLAKSATGMLAKQKESAKKITTDAQKNILGDKKAFASQFDNTSLTLTGAPLQTALAARLFENKAFTAARAGKVGAMIASAKSFGSLGIVEDEMKKVIPSMKKPELFALAMLPQFRKSVSDDTKAVLAKTLAKEDLIEDFVAPGGDSVVAFNNFLEAAKKEKMLKEILENRPDLPSLPSYGGPAFFGQSTADIMKKLSAAKAEGIGLPALNNAEVILNLSNTHLTNLARNGTTNQRQSIVATFKKIPIPTSADPNWTRINDFLSKNPHF